MIHYKSPAEVETMRESALLVGKAIAEVAKLIRPGITTAQLDKVADEFIRDSKATPSFKNFKGYPFASCMSVNDAVVHGFPSKIELKEGDIVSVDIGVYKNAFHGDSAYTLALGDPGAEVLQMMRVTKESLRRGIEKAVAGNSRSGDIFSYRAEQSAPNSAFSLRMSNSFSTGRSNAGKSEVLMWVLFMVR